MVLFSGFNCLVTSKVQKFSYISKFSDDYLIFFSILSMFHFFFVTL